MELNLTPNPNFFYEIVTVPDDTGKTTVTTSISFYLVDFDNHGIPRALEGVKRVLLDEQTSFLLRARGYSLKYIRTYFEAKGIEVWCDWEHAGDPPQRSCKDFTFKPLPEELMEQLGIQTPTPAPDKILEACLSHPTNVSWFTILNARVVAKECIKNNCAGYLSYDFKLITVHEGRGIL